MSVKGFEAKAHGHKEGGKGFYDYLLGLGQARGVKYRYATRKTSRGSESERGTEISLIRSQLRDSSRVDDEGEGVTRGMEREKAMSLCGIDARSLACGWSSRARRSDVSRDGKSSRWCSIRGANWRWSVWRISFEVEHSPVNTASGISDGVRGR